MIYNNLHQNQQFTCKQTIDQSQAHSSATEREIAEE